MPTEIVLCRAEDYDKLVEIWYRSVRDTHRFLTEDDFAFYHGLVREGGLRAPELWMETGQDGEPRGFIGLEGDMVDTLFVDPRYFGQGTGSRLLRHAEERKGRGLKVDVNEHNGSALRFYLRYGFVRTGRSERDGCGKPYPLLHLQLCKSDTDSSLGKQSTRCGIV